MIIFLDFLLISTIAFYCVLCVQLRRVSETFSALILSYHAQFLLTKCRRIALILTFYCFASSLATFLVFSRVSPLDSTQSQPTLFCRNLFVTWICLITGRSAGAPLTVSGIVSSSSHRSLLPTACDLFIQERVPQNVLYLSVSQLPADYICCISILKGRLLEHTDNV